MARNNSKILKNGFSSIELTIVSIVILIMVAISIPMIQQNLVNYRLDTATNLLVTELTFARMEAIKRNREVRMIIDAPSRTMTLETNDMGGSNITLGAPTVLPEGIVFQGTPPASVDFTSLGRNKLNGNSVLDLKIYGETNSRRITVSATGNVNVTTP